MNKNIQEAELCPKNSYKNEDDHRKIGKDQNLFSFHDEGPGFPFFHPKGVVLKNLLMEHWRKEHRLNDYEEIESPMMLNKDLWIQSGHWDLFKENMYVSEVDKGEFAIKPMNCPGSMLYYKEKKRSFKELPLRVCELGKVHRNENSGSLHGLMRVRSFIVDDAHIFCSGDQLQNEIKSVLKLAIRILKKFGFEELEYELSVRSEEKKEKYLGSDKDWALAEGALQSSMDDLGLSYKKIEGEAKFYGPAIDIKIKDSVGRNWQCSSIQMDFNLAKRFKLHYFDENDKKQVPYILHRCIFGSLERFMGILLEHYEGKLPFWISPVQFKVISVNEKVNAYAESIIEKLEEQGFRYKADLSDENLSIKMKKARQELVPVVLIVGEKEMEQRKVSARFRNGEKRNFVELGEVLGFRFD